MSFHEARRASTLAVVQVVRADQVSPNVRRITVGGPQLAPMPSLGYDQWFRLFLPNGSGQTSFALPSQLGLIGYLQYKRMPEAVRPVLRNYTVREFRPAQLELDIDVVVHGAPDDPHSGVANRWAQLAQPGETVALLDQGTGYAFADDTTEHLIVGDETGMPGILGILRDLPRDARGLAVIEVPDAADVQPVDAPSGIEVRWLARANAERPGTPALAVVRGWAPEHPETTTAYIVGERELPTSARRHLVSLGVPKSRITFVGFWRLGRAQY